MKKLIEQEDGAFTIEASLLLPSVFMVLLILMFLCLYLYQNALGGQVSALAAERAAYNWNNSSRESRTGALPEGEYDSLYWRLTDDDLLQSVFGWKSAEDQASIELPASSPSSSDALSTKKLTRTGSEVPSAYNGKMAYLHGLLSRRVQVGLNEQLPSSPLDHYAGGDWSVGADATSYVVEPTEWIRTVDLARYYTAKFRNSGSGGADEQEAGEALKLFGK
jgi:hypothetical protein